MEYNHCTTQSRYFVGNKHQVSKVSNVFQASHLSQASGFALIACLLFSSLLGLMLILGLQVIKYAWQVHNSFNSRERILHIAEQRMREVSMQFSKQPQQAEKFAKCTIAMHTFVFYQQQAYQWWLQHACCRQHVCVLINLFPQMQRVNKNTIKKFYQIWVYATNESDEQKSILLTIFQSKQRAPLANRTTYS